MMTPEHCRLFIISKLDAHRGDDLIRFSHRYGTPPDPSMITATAASFWDKPSSWNPCMTPREFWAQLKARDQQFDDAIAWVKEQV